MFLCGSVGGVDTSVAFLGQELCLFTFVCFIRLRLIAVFRSSDSCVQMQPWSFTHTFSSLASCTVELEGCVLTKALNTEMFRWLQVLFAGCAPESRPVHSAIFP